MMKTKLKIGQVVWATGGYYSKEIRETVITSIGKKYFEVASERRVKFFIETLRSSSNINYPITIYIDKQKYLDKQESDKLFQEIKRSFNGYQNTFALETLREIKKLIQ